MMTMPLPLPPTQRSTARASGALAGARAVRCCCGREGPLCGATPVVAAFCPKAAPLRDGKDLSWCIGGVAAMQTRPVASSWPSLSPPFSPTCSVVLCCVVLHSGYACKGMHDSTSKSTGCSQVYSPCYLALCFRAQRGGDCRRRRRRLSTFSLPWRNALAHAGRGSTDKGGLKGSDKTTRASSRYLSSVSSWDTPVSSCCCVSVVS